MQLPLLSRRTGELETCAFCPKLSRAACPVSAADGRETTTPWGKMSAAFLLSRGAVEPSAEQAWPPWACTGCFACRESCDLRNDVAGTLLDARADLMKQGLAPESAQGVVSRHAERVAQSDRGLQAAIERARSRGARVQASAEVTLLVGCLAARPTTENDPAGSTQLEAVEADPAADAIVATAMLARAPIAVASGCCGYPLRNAGDREGFVASARTMATSIAGARTLVVGDAGCAHTIVQRWAEVDAALPASIEVLHLSELAARNLRVLPALSEPDCVALTGGATADGSSVRYHDACSLGRGLGIYEPPRAVLTRLLGRAPDEFARKREGATCSGAGGIVPSTDPQNARAMAAARVAQHGELGGGAIVTTCAASRRAFGKQGVRAFDFATLLARALETTRTPEGR